MELPAPSFSADLTWVRQDNKLPTLTSSYCGKEVRIVDKSTVMKTLLVLGAFGIILMLVVWLVRNDEVDLTRH